ncbi:hypothetical protein, conserved [Trypanosoma brucei gambiense DAL972]|uniref:Uncharacterized protein n=1 Tax=Trypanosoma brucei gambiense (strain MHOM/CI/86/DAL972) TaxID=679716 RepID=C9ZM56_TRYB9|nr:hypothetical protein, conserved [Trypanosoma brucei gambiense DAL972]CBH10481.1 hypothetical protein, conserved [Trypanosoma brucei gambiense DAL972]|eukprot:XP_011772771.1 hypothetical protein, conserved [Trypanosoma brucei gambiense DAL972]
MADNSSASSPAQVVATVRHENILLKKCLAEVRHENQLLKKQLYRLSAILDIALSKLASKGITLETPVSIRELRAAIPSRDVIDMPAETLTSADVNYENNPVPSVPNRRFQLRREMREHTKPVQCVAFAPGDMPLLATGGLDCRLILHDFWTGEKVHAIHGHEQNVADVAWFEGSGNLLSASFDSTVKVWDPRHMSGSPSPIYQLKSKGFVLSAVPLDKAYTLVCTDSKRYTSIVDIRTKKTISWRHDVRVNALAFNGSKTQLVTGHNNGQIAIWDLRKVGSMLSSSMEGEGPNGGSQAVVDQTSVAHIPRLASVENEPSQSPITHISFYHNRDDSKRLVVVSADNMVRLYYEPGINPSLPHELMLRNVVGGVPTRGYTSKAAFWKGVREEQNVPAFFDDGEREGEAPSRRLTECDLMVTCGADNTACIYDVTERGNAVLVERLEGHRDRVVGAATHHADSKPIIATYSADNTVRTWVPVKT